MQNTKTKNRENSALTLETGGFFVLRTPLLPLADLDGPDSQLALLERAEIREALFIASPHLIDALEAQRRESSSKKRRRTEQSLTRYLTRMASRPTPFGLFSGCSIGRLGEKTRLRLESRATYQRHTRLDTDYLFALCEDLGRDTEVRARLRYEPNGSLYETAGRLRYAEARLDGRDRSYHLVAVDSDEYLEAVLHRAAEGATIDELSQVLVAADPDGEITVEDAAAFVHQLIDARILVSPLTPPVTGEEMIHALIEPLRKLAPEVCALLEETRDALGEIDDAGLGVDPARYRDAALRLETLDARVDLPRLFQVDMTKPARATLGEDVVDELRRGIGILHRLAGDRVDERLRRFRQDFQKRYEDAEVPLSEALDEEAGVGFDAGRGASSPLLAGIAFPPAPGEDKVSWTRWTNRLLAKIETLAPHDSSEIPEIELTDEDLQSLPDDSLAPLPDALQAMAVLAASSDEALDRGDFKILLRGAGGPSGARLLGRFCHIDPELSEHVREHLRVEEAHDPEAIYAEIVHLPEGRLGNILARPRLREYEIPFLGRGAAPRERQIPIDDLRVSVRGDRIVLRSARLGRRVIPRLTSAHNFHSARNLGVYRFLTHLQNDGVCSGMGWTWGALERFAFLPRVTCGRLVFSRARWLLRKDEIAGLVASPTEDREQTVEQWRSARRLPRRAVLADGDNELLVDFEDPRRVDAFLAVVGKRAGALLLEFFPGADELCATGPEGRFTQEIIVPFVRPRASSAESAASPVIHEPAIQEPAPQSPAIRRTFPPGSEWLYLKLFTGVATADRVLCELAPTIRSSREAYDRWFFIRYGDPDWHLRLRFHGEPARLHGEVLPRLQNAASRLLDEGVVRRVQLDTYSREIERYGGTEGIELAEALAQIDSEAVLRIVELLDGDEGAAARWKLALRGSALLLDDLGFDADVRLEIAERMQRGFGQEHRFDTATRKQLSARLRRDRRELEELLATSWSAEHPLAPGFEILKKRSERLRPIVEELRRRAAAGKLTKSLETSAPSFVHMFNNRILRSQARAQEAVLYDFLHQLLYSRRMRERSKKAVKRNS